jgi:hypothetical protein
MKGASEKVGCNYITQRIDTLENDAWRLSELAKQRDLVGLLRIGPLARFFKDFFDSPNVLFHLVDGGKGFSS